MQKRYVQRSIFLILLLVLGSLLWINRSKFEKKKQIVVKSNQPSGSDFPISSLPNDNLIFGKKNVELPFVLSNSSEGSVLLHYFINGTVKEVKNTSEGSQIILTSASTSSPPFILSKDTRISKITPPYGQANSQPLTSADLTSGNNIVISVEYDFILKTWIVRDVLLPTDRN